MKGDIVGKLPTGVNIYENSIQLATSILPMGGVMDRRLVSNSYGKKYDIIVRVGDDVTIFEIPYVRNVITMDIGKEEVLVSMGESLKVISDIETIYNQMQTDDIGGWSKLTLKSLKQEMSDRIVSNFNRNRLITNVITTEGVRSTISGQLLDEVFKGLPLDSEIEMSKEVMKLIVKRGEEVVSKFNKVYTMVDVNFSGSPILIQMSRTQPPLRGYENLFSLNTKDKFKAILTALFSYLGIHFATQANKNLTAEKYKKEVGSFVRCAYYEQVDCYLEVPAKGDMTHSECREIITNVAKLVEMLSSVVSLHITSRTLGLTLNNIVVYFNNPNNIDEILDNVKVEYLLDNMKREIDKTQFVTTDRVILSGGKTLRRVGEVASEEAREGIKKICKRFNISSIVAMEDYIYEETKQV